MKTTNRRITVMVLSVVMLALVAASLFCVTVSAGEVITDTVNIATANKNERGSGYDWANRTDTLTLSGLNIDTEEAYGLRLPGDCTVILEGNNTIKAAKYGISFSGTVIFKGNGSLTIDAGEIGLYIITQDYTQKVRFLGGDYDITAGKYGVYSDYADFSFVGDKMNITVNDTENGAAIQGRIVNLLGGTFSANAAVNAEHAVTVDGINLDISANAAALSAKNLTVRNLSVEYNGENAISAQSTAKSHRTSAVFGEECPGWVDYILLAVLAVGVAAGIFGPAMRRKKKAKELYERLEREGYKVPEK